MVHQKETQFPTKGGRRQIVGLVRLWCCLPWRSVEKAQTHPGMKAKCRGDSELLGGQEEEGRGQEYSTTVPGRRPWVWAEVK